MNDSNGLTTILEGTLRELRELVRQEVKTALAEVTPSGGVLAPGTRWLTPPRAARALGISEKAVRNMIKEGVIQRRLRNISQTPTQPKYLVNIEEVAAVASREHAAKAPGVSIEEEARRILSARDSRK